MDISDTIIVKSDQLNAEDLLPGPITVTITGIKRTQDEQPVSIEITGGHRPWKPCKTMRRLMIFAWPDCVKPQPNGAKPIIDPTVWIGRSITLMRDPTVKWAGALVGGIRISAMSHISAKFEIALAETKGKKKLVTVEKLTQNAPAQPQQAAPATPPHPLAAPFSAMQTLWKKRSAAAGLTVTAADLAQFISTACEGVISVENARKLEAHTIETIAKVVETIEFEMPTV